MSNEANQGATAPTFDPQCEATKMDKMRLNWLLVGIREDDPLAITMAEQRIFDNEPKTLAGAVATLLVVGKYMFPASGDEMMAGQYEAALRTVAEVAGVDKSIPQFFAYIRGELAMPKADSMVLPVDLRPLVTA